MVSFIKKLLGLSKKVETKPPKPNKIKIINYKSEIFNLKKAIVKITFTNKSAFNTTIYGYLDQYTSHTNGIVNEPRVITAEEEARSYIMTLDGSKTQTFVDDPRNISLSVAGIPKSMKIVNIEDFETKCAVAYLEEVEQ